MDRPYERVYTVNDFWDRPRAGFADVDGHPHAYRSIWREDLDDWDPDGRFLLQPISGELLALAREGWEIWLRWVKAYEADPSIGPTHPAIPADRVRHAELAPVIAQALEIDASWKRMAVGDFRKRDPKSERSMSRSELEVRWTPVE